MGLYLYKIANVYGKYLLALTLVAALAGCGGGDEVKGGPPGVSSNPPAAVRITYPVSNAIQDLGGGVYRRRGSVVVTDSEGNAVADGTRVKLNVIDSVKAYGTITGGATISGATITDTAPLLGDFFTATFFDTASVDRGFTQRFIEENDLVLFFNAFDTDRVRIVGPVSASNPTNTTLTMTQGFSTNYPNTVYDGAAFITEYIVGSSLLGVSVAGEGGTVGYATTSNGIGNFYVTYPADVNHIGVGCSLAALDTRHLPAGSAATFLVAEVDKFEHVNTIDSGFDNGFCFSPVIGGEIIARQNGNAVEGWCKDGGDGVALPFTEISYSSSDATVGVSSPAISDEDGFFVAPLTGAAGATATISLECNQGAKASVTVTLN